MPDEPRPFGLMLRRPGEAHTACRAPGFDKPESDFTIGGGDPRWDEGSGQHWALSLPHQCQEWLIGEGEHAEVLAAAERFREELDQAIDALRAEFPLPDGPRYYVKVTAREGDVNG